MKKEFKLKKPVVSLIMPVYNVEKYLEKALRSVQNQTFKDFELIIVNDGSTDGSVDIIEKFCSENENFKLINQENQGPSVARNTGIKESRGEYIGFMDSDDYLEPKFLELLYTAAVDSDADIACCNFNMYYPAKKLKIFMPFTSFPGVYSKTKALRKLILDIGVHYFVWNKLSKRSLFFDNNLKFDKMYFEDIATSPKMFYYADKIVFLGEALYNYTSRESSILHSMNVVKINDFIKSLGVIRNFLENEKVYKNYNGHIWVYAQKVKIVSYYYILMLHANAMNFKGFWENIASATKSIDYFSGSSFVPNKEKSIPDLISLVKAPPKNKKNKIKKNK